MNNIKNVIQKEEYISLAINKYILQTANIPKKNDNSLDWDLLTVDDYLGLNFNKINPLTLKEMKVVFDSKNTAYILGVIENINAFKEEYNYLYNFYTNKIFRVNTIPPKSTINTELVKGSQVLYNDIQQKIVLILNKNETIKFPNQTCLIGEYFYELRNGELIYRYCKTATDSIIVYQKAPIYLENLEDLKYIVGNIGDKAYLRDGITWYEYEYIGNFTWENVINKDKISSNTDEASLEDKILSYIPDSKDLVLKGDGGCMLANGDIFCWGNNKYKRAGIESYGQLDNTLIANYVNTPVMLKVQIDDTTQNSIKWYNNPYRVKFEKMSMNNKFVCGISPIINGYDLGERKKYGGNLYCNGYVHSDYFELGTTLGQTETSILRKNKLVASGKENGVYNPDAIYLQDFVMVDGTWGLLSDTGKIYTVGSNDKGGLGIGSNDSTIYTYVPQIINPNGITFKKIYALRDIKGFGALDDQNYFWIWGERANGTIYNKPTILSNSLRFNADVIFTNSKEFVLKGVDNRFYRTYSDISYKDMNIPSSALSVSVYDYNGYEYYMYINEFMQLIGSSIFTTCREKDGTICSIIDDNNIFNISINYLNSRTNTINNTLYANFSNVSIFETKVSKIIANYGTDYTEDFENGSTTGWNKTNLYDGGTVGSKFLGRFGKNVITVDGSQQVYKTFDLGIANANKNIKITFDMYEIDSWDAGYYYSDNLNGRLESFFVYLNNLKIREDIYANDDFYTSNIEYQGTMIGNILGTDSSNEEKHTYTIITTLDAAGKVKLGFGAILGEDYTNESFGIDNIRISKQIENVSFSSGVFLEDFENGLASDWIVPQGPVPFTTAVSEFYKYPVYTDSGSATKFLGRFNRKDGGGGVIYHGNSDSTEEVYKIFSFGPENANKEVQIEYDFYRIDNWRNILFYTRDLFYTFINKTRYLTYSTGDFVSNTNLNEIDNTDWLYADYKSHFTRKEYLDEFGNIRLGFGAYIKDNYINQTSWGIDNVKFTLTGVTRTGTSSGTAVEVGVPYICTMTGLGSASQMYCWGNVGRSIPILSTSLYDVDKIKNNLGTINKLFISQESQKNIQMAFDKYNNDGNLFLKYPTYIGGFDYAFYFK